MSNNSDIGWLDKSKVDATLRNLKDRKRVRRRTTDTPSEASDAPEEFVDLFGVSKPTPIQTQRSQSPSYIKPADPVPEQTTEQRVPATPAASTPPTVQPAATSPATPTIPAVTTAPATPETPAAATTPTTPVAPTASTVPTTETPARRQTTAPTSTLVATQETTTIPDALPESTPPQSVTTSASNQRPAQQLTATVETTPIVAHEPDDGPTAAEDLSDRFKDAFDVLRASDPSHPTPRTDTAEIRPLSPSQPAAEPEDLALEHTTSSAPAQDLSLQSAGRDQTARAPSSDDLQLHDVAPSASFTPKPTDDVDSDDDDDAVSLPAHDLDLSIQTTASPIDAFEQTTETPVASDEIVFDVEDFTDEQSTSQRLTAQYLDEMQLTSGTARSDADTDEQTSGDHTTPEHAFVPKIHSQILKTVRLRNAPDPTDSETLYRWFQEIHNWIKNTETSATQFLVADHAGLSLLDTGIDESTVARAVAIRRSMAELHDGGDANTSGYTVFRNQEDKYMNLVWAPSEHGTITVGILSDHVYPDARLATLEEKLVRGINTLPFV